MLDIMLAQLAELNKSVHNAIHEIMPKIVILVKQGADDLCAWVETTAAEVAAEVTARKAANGDCDSSSEDAPPVCCASTLMQDLHVVNDGHTRIKLHQAKAVNITFLEETKK